MRLRLSVPNRRIQTSKLAKLPDAEIKLNGVSIGLHDYCKLAHRAWRQALQSVGREDAGRVAFTADNNWLSTRGREIKNASAQSASQYPFRFFNEVNSPTSEVDVSSLSFSGLPADLRGRGISIVHQAVIALVASIGAREGINEEAVLNAAESARKCWLRRNAQILGPRGDRTSEQFFLVQGIASSFGSAAENPNARAVTLNFLEVAFAATRMVNEILSLNIPVEALEQKIMQRTSRKV